LVLALSFSYGSVALACLRPSLLGGKKEWNYGASKTGA